MWELGLRFLVIASMHDSTNEYLTLDQSIMNPNSSKCLTEYFMCRTLSQGVRFQTGNHVLHVYSS